MNLASSCSYAHFWTLYLVTVQLAIDCGNLMSDTRSTQHFITFNCGQKKIIVMDKEWANEENIVIKVNSGSNPCGKLQNS